jgi:hypothetical protein
MMAGDAEIYRLSSAAYAPRKEERRNDDQQVAGERQRIGSSRHGTNKSISDFFELRNLYKRLLLSIFCLRASARADGLANGVPASLALGLEQFVVSYPNANALG